MTGAEHYLAAESLLEGVSIAAKVTPETEAGAQAIASVVPLLLAEAQVHATLALAAASNFPDQDGYGS